MQLSVVKAIHIMTVLSKVAQQHLTRLTIDIPQRYVGSKGNQESTDYFHSQLRSFGWDVITEDFTAFDWINDGAILEVDGCSLEVFSSPYANGCDVQSEMVAVSTMKSLEHCQADGKILVIHGDLAREPLMPKNFVFYNPESHKKIVKNLEESGAVAIICIANNGGDRAGGEYPYSIIEDGDFIIPSVFMEEKEGEKLLAFVKQKAKAKLVSMAERRPSKGCNVIGLKGPPSAKQITITAHIDSKRGSPGAIDNATGITTLMLLAQLLEGYNGPYQLEIVALNGEDYYSVPGQMTYMANNKDRFLNKILNINIDGAGLKDSPTALSFFNLPKTMEVAFRKVVIDENQNDTNSIVEGKPWVQGDHSMFAQSGVPAVAISSEWLIDHISTQEITHTPNDNIEITDPEKLVQLAVALSKFLTFCA